MGEGRGYSLRTPRFRYTEWLQTGSGKKPNWGKIVSRELYDHITDPGENWNSADEERYADVVMELSQLLRGGWKKALQGL